MKNGDLMGLDGDLNELLPSGKRATKNYGKSRCLTGKSTISMAIFNNKLLVYQAGYISHGSCSWLCGCLLDRKPHPPRRF